MNQLTKDELQKIFNFIEHHKQDSYYDMKFSTIMEKIKSMIDDYCEHESDKLSGLWVSKIVQYKCKKCRELIND